MATNAMTKFEQAPLPAHIAAAEAAVGRNIDPRNTTPQLSFRGKVWRTVIEGDETPMTNSEGDPISSVNVVILNFSKARSRTYFEGAFEEGKSQAPVCWSTDGVTPDNDVKNKQSATCATCKWSVKGSKTGDTGKLLTACAVNKRVVVVPTADVHFTPMLLKVPQTSMWDGKNEENEKKGFYAFDQYIDMLRKRGCNHSGFVSTRIKYDPRMAYPKLLFSASRWLEESEIAEVTPLFKSEAVIALLTAPEGVTAPPVNDGDDDDAPAPKAVKAPKAAPAADPDDDDDDVPAPKAVKAVKAPKAAPAADPDDDDDDDDVPPPKAKVAKPVDDDDDDDAPMPPPPKVKPVKAVKAAKAAPAADPDDDDDDALPPATKPKVFTLDDVRAAVAAFKAEHGLELVPMLYARVGATKLSGVTPDLYAQVMELIAGGPTAINGGAEQELQPAKPKGKKDDAVGNAGLGSLLDQWEK